MIRSGSPQVETFRADKEAQIGHAERKPGSEPDGDHEVAREGPNRRAAQLDCRGAVPDASASATDQLLVLAGDAEPPGRTVVDAGRCRRCTMGQYPRLGLRSGLSDGRLAAQPGWPAPVPHRRAGISGVRSCAAGLDGCRCRRLAIFDRRIRAGSAHRRLGADRCGARKAGGARDAADSGFRAQPCRARSRLDRRSSGLPDAGPAERFSA